MTVKNVHDASEVDVTPLDPSRIRSAKISHAVRRLDIESIARYLLRGTVVPKSGDVVLARVETIRNHKRLELDTGRKSILFPGDEVVVCYGNRYAPDQFCAKVPQDLGPCSLVAAGGMAADVVSQHKSIAGATDVTPIGLLADSSTHRINLMQAAVPATEVPVVRPPTIASVGTSMNSGKTLSAAQLVKGFKRCGYRVGAAKVTGTAAGNDTWLMRDAGADEVLDFVDAGYVSTFGLPARDVQSILCTLVNRLGSMPLDVIVIEVADGIHQMETAALLESECFRDLVDGVMFSARDASGACAGIDLIRRLRHRLVAVSGALGASPLAMEESRTATGELVADVLELATAEMAEHILSRATGGAPIAQAL